ncbi:hypothetical protein F5B18DRAFT_656730 [Nemania serpens]|nr:hypothetical protein F5B18DRAFT_656730 [Nemania serpens]
MRWQEIANATPEPSSAKRKASGSSSSHPLLDATADSDVPRPLPSPSKRPVSTIEVQAEDATEHQHTHKRARTEGEATATEDGEVRGSDCSSDTRRSISPWPGIDEIESQQEDPSECEAYRRFRLQRLPSPAPSDADGDDFPPDLDADEFSYTPLMLSLDNDDPRVEEVFGLAYTQKLERLKLRNPSHRPAAQAGPGGPCLIQHPPWADDPNQDSTPEIDDKSSFGAEYFSSKTSTTITRPGRPSSLRITRQSLRRNTVFYELDRRAQARVAKSQSSKVTDSILDMFF